MENTYTYSRLTKERTQIRPTYISTYMNINICMPMSSLFFSGPPKTYKSYNADITK